MADNLPSVSVVIPVYGRSDTIKDAIESVFMQSTMPKEIIVVDDCSSEPLIYAIKPYLSKITYIKNEKNMGVSYSRNVGIKASSGDFVAFLDSDDVWLRDKLAIQMNFMVSGNYQLSHTDEFWFRSGKWLNRGKKHIRYGGDIFCGVLDMCRVSPSTLAVRRDVFDKVGFFDENLRVCEDYEFTLRAALAYKVGYIDKKLLIKRAFTGDQLSASIAHIESLRLNILKNFAAAHPEIEGSRKDALEEELARKGTIVKFNP